MHFASLCHLPELPASLHDACKADERTLIAALAAALTPSPAEEAAIAALLPPLVRGLRQRRKHAPGIDNLLAEYPLATQEGQSLLILAESLLRIPDHASQNHLIREILAQGHWQQHAGQSESWPINLATRGLQTAARLVDLPLGPSLIRGGFRQALQWASSHFVMADSILNALEIHNPEYRYSYDMLGESALSSADAERYLAAYNTAIHHVGLAAAGAGPWHGPGISIKLSALHPRFECTHAEPLRTELYPRLLELAEYARSYDIGLTIDAEEYERTPLMLGLFKQLAHEPSLADWEGLGIAVQAYQKQSSAMIGWLNELARSTRRRIMVRLVKGAYWDSEIKRAQTRGLGYYPVFTHKAHTDLCYLACAKQILATGHWLHPQFATHNPNTLARLHIIAGDHDVEFQCLYGMGESLIEAAREQGIERPFRLYAPVGKRAVLLPYLVRRLLENGANTSFNHQLFTTSTETLCAAPQPNTALDLPLPPALFGTRINSPGIDWSSREDLEKLESEINAAARSLAQTARSVPQADRQISNPADPVDIVGAVQDSTISQLENALDRATRYSPIWQDFPIAQRADLLDRAADMLFKQRGELLLLLCREAGKTLPDAYDELREAIDYCRYYASEARRNWPDQNPAALGNIVAISPWNFPLAILVGQIAAALVAGNCVLAKAAPETPLIAERAIACLHRAGIPDDALHLLCGGSAVGATLVADPRCDSVLFTGSLRTARQIQSQLTERATPLLAETSGLNFMLADSTIHIEQTVVDILRSAFNSAGQRCSALRVLCVQDEVAERLIGALQNAIQELHLGNPMRLDTDLGPLISAAAQQRIESALAHFQEQGCPIWQAGNHLPAQGYFLPPTLVEIESIQQVPGEIFGPVLCVLRYRPRKLKALLGEMTACGYRLTLGVQSRSNRFFNEVLQASCVGNYYQNRSQIGAVVESQPFGGCGLSGTGPQAGGPWYLWALVRNGAPAQPIGQQALPEELAALAREWPSEQASKALHRHYHHYARHTPIGLRMVLAGPCGEKNLRRIRPRGLIACMGPNQEDLANQVCAALLTGNSVVLPGNVASQAIAGYLRAMPVQVVRNPLALPALNAVLYNGPDAPSLAQQLAARSGAIIPLFQPLNDGHYPLFRLVEEISISINETAVGGDLALLNHEYAQPRTSSS